MAKLQETMSVKVLIIARAVKRKTNPERIRTARLGKKRFKNPKSHKYDKMTVTATEMRQEKSRLLGGFG